MPAVVIQGCPPWDGRYEFEDFAFTNRELFEIRKLSGLRAAELIDALEENDTAAYVGVALVVLARAGKQVDPDDLWEAKVGSLTISLNGGDSDPPTTGGEPAEPTSSADGSGDGSTSAGASPAKTP